jgi:hypothetical protein
MGMRVTAAFGNDLDVRLEESEPIARVGDTA